MMLKQSVHEMMLKTTLDLVNNQLDYQRQRITLCYCLDRVCVSHCSIMTVRHASHKQSVGGVMRKTTFVVR